MKRKTLIFEKHLESINIRWWDKIDAYVDSSKLNEPGGTINIPNKTELSAIALEWMIKRLERENKVLIQSRLNPDNYIQIAREMGETDGGSVIIHVEETLSDKDFNNCIFEALDYVCKEEDSGG